MTTSNVTLTTHLLAKRGNTSVSSTYTGLVGELTVDTDLTTVRVHDGSTAGGHILANTSQVSDPAGLSAANVEIDALRANVTASNVEIDALRANITAANAQIATFVANAGFATQSNFETLDANVGSFQTYANTQITTLDANLGTATTNITTLDSNLGTATTNITTLDANLGTATTNITTIDANLGTFSGSQDTINANIGAFQLYSNANVGALTLEIDNLFANAGAQSTTLQSLQSNAIAQQALLDTLTSNAATQYGELVDLTANAATQANELITLLSNAATQSTDLSTLLSNAAFQHTAIGDLQTNAAAQHTSITTLDANVGTIVGTTIPTLDANLGTATTNISTLDANVGAYQTYANANAAAQASSLTTLNANAGVQADHIDNLYGNAGVQAAHLDTLDANLGSATTNITTLDANLGTATTNISTLDSNIGAYQVWANAEIISSNVDMKAYVDNQVFESGGYTNSSARAFVANIDGNVIPNANATYYLGDSTRQWKELWVAGATIYLGNIPIQMSTASDPTLLINNQPITANVTNTTDANIGAISNNVTTIDANLGTATTNISTIDANLGTATTNITTIDANLGTATTNITTHDANIGTIVGTTIPTIDANLGVVVNTTIPTLDANVGTITTDISTLLANAAAQADVLNTLSGNAVTQETELASLVANAASQADDLTTLLANAATQTGELTTLTANAAAQAGAIDNINANVGSYQTYANATFASSTDFGNFTLTNNSITTDDGDDGIDLKISGADSNDPPAFVQQTWRLAANGSIQFLDPFLSSILANGVINTTKIGEWDNTYANLVPGINANIGAFQTYANLTFATGSDLDILDANVGTIVGTTIPTLDANVGSFQTYANATFGVGSSQWTTTGDDIYYTTGNVGIGTTGPSYPLHVTSSDDVLARFDGSGKANTGSVEVDILGPQSNGDIQIGIGGSGITDASNNIDNKGFVASGSTLDGLNLRADNGFVQITAGGITSADEVARFTASGNVGIGNTSPASKLTVAGVVESTSGGIKFPDGTTQTTASTGVSDSFDANVGALSNSITTIDANLGTATTNITNLDANVGTFQTYANSTFGTGSLDNVVEDTTPQLGGNLDMNSNSITGSLKVEDGTQERFSAKTGATGNVAHDCTEGHVFYHSSISSNFTASFLNLDLSQSYVTTLTLVLNQGATGFIANAVEISGASQTIEWQGNVTPTATDNGVDVMSFSVLNNAGTYVVLGQLVDFGG